MYGVDSWPHDGSIPNQIPRHLTGALLFLTFVADWRLFANGQLTGLGVDWMGEER